MPTGKCPKCEKVAHQSIVEDVDLSSGAAQWKGANYLCPHCRTILSVSLDPLALKNEILRAIQQQSKAK